MDASLGQRYIDKVTLHLADYDEQLLAGATEKYVLRDNSGKKWLFKKIYNVQDELKTYCTYRLTKIFGIHTPEMYKTSLTINGMPVAGFIQRLLPSTYLSAPPYGFIKPSERKILASLIKYGIFNWWVKSDAVECLISPSGRVYLVDLNSMFEFDDKNLLPPIAYLNKQLFPVQEAENMAINFEEANIFLYYMGKNLNQKSLEKYLKAEQYTYETENYINRIVKFLVERKKDLLNDLCSPNLFNCHLHKKRHHLKYLMPKIRVYKMLLANIIRHIPTLFLKSKSYKNELAVISSGRGWEVLMMFLDLELIDSLEKGSHGIPSKEIYRLFSSFESKLASTRRMSDCFNEKLAITLYMRQLRTFWKYIKKYNGFESIDVFVPIIQDIDTFQHPASTDRWFSFTKYQTEGTISIVKLEGEAEYIQGLIKLINHQNDEAIQYLLIAKEKGYAIDEIADLTVHTKYE